MAGPSNDSIAVQRIGNMISPTDGYQTLKPAHFLSASATAIGGPFFDLPSDGFSSGNAEKPKVKFFGWKGPQREWIAWVDRMRSAYQSVWENAGIHDAILNSKYTIRRNEDLIFEFGERWCPETNTFVFPWGEATITLEDVMVLGSYSVLGEPVFGPVETEETKEIGRKLQLARREIYNSTAKKASQSLWIRKFTTSETEIEHEAFLSLWLSRFVFPISIDSVPKCVLPIAIHLARGTRIALAPGVLACLYANLTKLKKALVAFQGPANNNQKDKNPEPKISAPMELVQIWVWERFPTLQPKPKDLRHDQPRFYKWNRLESKVARGIVKLAMLNAAENFNWRPYRVDGKTFLTTKRKGEQTMVALHMEEEQAVATRCMRASELVGLDRNCIEQYLPHRVAMQFGLDQDVPGHLSRAGASQMVAWQNYNRPIWEERMCFPSCLLKSDATSHVTTPYLYWWKKTISAARGGDVNFEKIRKRKFADDLTAEAQNDCSKSATEGKDKAQKHTRHENSIRLMGTIVSYSKRTK